MKLIISLITLLLIPLANEATYSQNYPTYPIPSFNISVSQLANFQESDPTSVTDQTRGKRQVNVQVRSGSDNGPCDATVWIYTLDRTTILGPYNVNCGETLTVEIDDREWGVLVESDYTIEVDVWFTVIF